MTPQRWRQITEIFYAALAHDPVRRDAFLGEQCASDPELRSEVESLIAAHGKAGAFGDTPAFIPASPLDPGTLVGPYRIDSFLGAGGMGEVYRARDPRLERDVAIKVLPAHLTADPERLARFEREARTLASLNHPHIGAIYGIEEFEGGQALVMELVEGEDLSQRLSRGPIPLAEALPMARQTADALEAAHEQGIVHCDLKPANIKVRDDDTVKVLDFGLAKAVGAHVSVGGRVEDSQLSSTHAVQGEMIVGTPAYMSPEQARGKTADKRSDIWSFGVVFCEMLTARPLYDGDTPAETLAAVTGGEPDLRVLPASTPTAIRALIGRCLTKDQRTRLQAIGEARIAIERVLSQPDTQAPGEAGRRTEKTSLRPVWLVLPWAFAVAAFGFAGFALWTPWRPVTPALPVRLGVELTAHASIASSAVGAATILSPDGLLAAFVAQDNGSGTPQVYVRRLDQLDQLQATPLSGTEDAESPFFSPDGLWIAFFSGGRVKKVSVTGGAAVTLCDAPNGRGGAWAEDGTIVLSPSPARTGLVRVSPAGGKTEPVTSLAEGEATHRWPQILPGGRAVLYTSSSSPGNFSDANLVVQPLPSGARKVVQRGGYYGRYVPSGHLLYIHDGRLIALPFDLDRLEITGQPVSVLEDVASNADTGGAQFSVSASGTLVYLPGHSAGSGALIHWMNQEGETTPLRATLLNWSNLLFAPDGRHLAMQIAGPGPSDIWVYEWARDTPKRLTFDPAFDSKPVWTPDGRRIGFASARADSSTLNLYWQRADGTGDVQRLTESNNQQRPASWHRNRRVLAFEELNPATSWDLMILPIQGNETSGWKPGNPTVFANTPSAEREPMFSPDGRWLAYHSNESGRNEVYVRPFPGPGGTWQISTGGGSYPTWSRTKRELFYSLNGQIMVASFAAEDGTFRVEKPRRWSEGRYLERAGNRGFDLHPDGERLAVALPMETPSDRKQDKVVFIFNFLSELRRVAPATER